MFYLSIFLTWYDFFSLFYAFNALWKDLFSSSRSFYEPTRCIYFLRGKRDKRVIYAKSKLLFFRCTRPKDWAI